MIQEIITLNGEQFQIAYETPKDRIYALADAENQYMNENMYNQYDPYINTLTATCTTSTKYVGQSVTLGTAPTSGTPPYKYVFYKMAPGTTTATNLDGTALSAPAAMTGTPPSASTTHILTSADVTTINGQPKFGVLVYDSCGAGALVSDESCYVNVLACTQPAANFSLS